MPMMELLFLQHSLPLYPLPSKSDDGRSYKVVGTEIIYISSHIRTKHVVNLEGENILC